MTDPFFLRISGTGSGPRVNVYVNCQMAPNQLDETKGFMFWGYFCKPAGFRERTTKSHFPLSYYRKGHRVEVGYEFFRLAYECFSSAKHPAVKTVSPKRHGVGVALRFQTRS